MRASDPQPADAQQEEPEVSGLRTPLVSDSVVEITAASRPARLSDLIRQREVLRELVDRDLKSRYKQSVLGPVWLVVQPMGLLLAFLVVFAGLLDIETQGTSYALFATSGLTIWVFFQSALTFGANALIANLSLVKLVPFPRIALPTAGILSAAPVLTLPLVLTLVLSLALGDEPTARVLLMPLGLAWIFLFTWGLVVLLSSIIVHFRDILYALPFLLQAGIFVSPVAYPTSRVDNDLVSLVFTLNPLTGIIEFWRWLVLPVQAPGAAPVISAIIWTLVLCVGGWLTFRRLDPTAADVI